MDTSFIAISSSLSGETYKMMVPVQDVDLNAFNTVRNAFPDFVVPYSSKQVNEDVEFVFAPSPLGKVLRYNKTRKPEDYRIFWRAVLEPLANCGDWFMQPFSFVLHPDFVFYDNRAVTQPIRYLYVPGSKPCSNMEDLQELLKVLVNANECTDKNVEAEFLRAIVDFNFDKLLEVALADTTQKPQPSPQHQAAAPAPPSPPPVAPPAEAVPNTPAAPPRANPAPAPMPEPAAVKPIPVPEGKLRAGRSGNPYDVDIHIASAPADEEEPGGKKTKKAKATKNSSKKEKEPRSGNVLQNLFGGGKKKEGGFVGGAASMDDGYILNIRPIGQGNGYVNLEDHLSVGDMDREMTTVGPRRTGAPPAPTTVVGTTGEPLPASTVAAPLPEYGDDKTIISPRMRTPGGPHLRFVGVGDFPQNISIKSSSGNTFTIGRYDASLGLQQSDYEFPQKTRAVSRQHACIEWNDGRYCIIDLNSSAGTFLNGQMVVPNVPHPVSTQDKVSFGNEGADYILELP